MPTQNPLAAFAAINHPWAQAHGESAWHPTHFFNLSWCNHASRIGPTLLLRIGYVFTEYFRDTYRLHDSCNYNGKRL
jgi:hypothetical protein